MRWKRSEASNDCVVGECSWKDCMRTQRSSPSAVRAHHERPSSRAYVGQRAVHVGGDRGHLLGIEPAAQVQEPGLGEEVRDLGVVVVGAERAMEVERCAVTIAEVDVAAGVHRPGVDERAQHDPPVEEVRRGCRAACRAGHR